ncbi:MAG: hypothetical protein HN576_01305, partial [Bacteriovoracaceae bacterium]|nr:hypothetical protein [Bacteriovoracaceae bacterium]
PKNSANPKAKIQSEAASNTCLLDYGESELANCTGTKVCSEGDNDGRFHFPPCPSGSNPLPITSATSNETMYHLVLESNGADVCQGARTSSTFASGRGDLRRPFTICNANQFNNIGGDTYLALLHYEVLKDLDFNVSTNVVSNCTLYRSEILHNFIPIGGGFNTACDDITTLSASAGFNGSFNGNDFTFLAPRFIFTDTAPTGALNMGLFRKTLNNSVIQNIKINHGHITGKSQVGLLVGNCDGNIKNIEITHSSAEDRDPGNSSDIGAVAGIGAGNCIIDNVSVYKTSVSGSSHNVGGIIGSTAGMIRKTQFFGDVEAHNSDNVGGIAGKLDLSGSALEVAVEGVISSNGIDLGGIVGWIGSSAKLEDAYMKGAVYSNKFENTGFAVDVGGIVGNNTGTVARTLFIGHIEDNCTNNSSPTTCKVGKLSGTGTAPTISYSQSDFGTLNKGGNDGTEQSDLNLRNHTKYGASWDFNSANPKWRHTTNPGDYPRLEMQKDHQCELAPNQDTVTAQQNPGRGTATNPIIICNIAQLKEIGNSTTNLALNYKMADNISLWGWGISDSPINFSGSLDGAGFSLLGGELGNHNVTESGFFASTTATGSISNLNLLGLKNFAGTGDQAGGVVGVNNGIITNVLFQGLVDGNTNVGLITGKNTGNIIGSQAFGLLAGYSLFGGIAGENASSATILKSESEASITNSANSANKAGGITGENSGTLDQVSFFGRIEESMSNIYSGDVGGIAGTNNSIIKNSSFSGVIEITDSTNVGGIAGDNTNSSEIKASVSFGEVKHLPPGSSWASTGANSDSWGPIFGLNSGTVGSGVLDNVYWTDDAFEIYFESSIFENVSTCNSISPYSTAEIGFQPTSSTENLSPDEIYLVVNDANSHQFKITSISTTGALIINTNDVDECPLILSAGTSFETRQYKETSSTEGVQLSLLDARDISTYCQGAAGTTDPDFKCAANDGFDIIYEYVGSDDIGTQRFLDQIFAEVYNQAPPTPPIWVISDRLGARPKLFQK